MMKLISVLVVAIIAVALAAPQNPDADAVVLRYDSDNIGIDGYNYAVETSNGIRSQEQGQLKNAGTDNEILAVSGSYSYVGQDGKTYTVTYTADENGFQPQGEHLPQAP